jgi:hypothetical protein
MRLSRYLVVLVVAALLPAPSPAADAMASSSASHMAAISWLTGTYACSQHTAYADGKVRNVKSTLVFSSLQNGWIHLNVKGSQGSTYYGYDPKKNRYVMVSVGGPGEYGAGYFHIAPDRSMVFEFPDAIDNDPSSYQDYFKVTPGSAGFSGGSSGMSVRYPGQRYTSTFTCTRQ